MQLLDYRQNLHNLLKRSAQEIDIPVTYSLKKSSDNINFLTLTSFEKSKPGSGMHTYEYSDVQIHSSTLYYRIKMIRELQLPVYSNTVLLPMQGQSGYLLLTPKEKLFNKKLLPAKKMKIFSGLIILTTSPQVSISLLFTATDNHGNKKF
jgi:hypothetical protein